MTHKPWGTMILALMASLCIYLLRSQGSSAQLLLALENCMLIAIAIGVRIAVSRQRSRASEPRVHLAVRTGWWWPGVGMILVPWILRAVQLRWLGGPGEAIELVWLAMLQYAALWQAAIATRDKEAWFSFLMSCFLVIFGLATSDRDGMLNVVGPFAIVAAWWLMTRYWDSIEHGFVASDSVPLLPMRVMVLSGMVLVALAVIGVAARGRHEIVWLDGFMPTSGGRDRAEASARQGIGDGDMLVAARDEAFTFGPVDTDVFMDSEVPSMYDLVSEIYGEPTPRKRSYARAISLDNRTQESDQEGTESKKNSREFAAIRQPADGPQSIRPEGTSSNAIAYLLGRAPEWLRLETFDRFEDDVWYQSESLDLTKHSGEPTLQMIADKPWMFLQSAPRALIYPVRERLAIKIIQFKSPRLLTPSLTSHVHIDRIDQPDFFDWTPDGQLRMPNREHVPQLTVVHELTQTPQLHPLRQPNHPMRYLTHSVAAHRARSDWLWHYLECDEQSSGAIGLAQEWLTEAGCDDRESTTDWVRVEAIVNRLRRDFVHDPQAVVPENGSPAIEHVLATGKGTDYLLASTAVQMIRSLGVPCRLCRGFFVSPERYDYKSGQTEVLPEDLHTWAEVYAHGLWIPIEPTGTYPVPREHRTWQQWAIESGWGLRDSIRRNPSTTALVFVGIVIGLLWRRRILEFGLCLVFLFLQFPSERLRMLGALRLLRWRMWLWGDRRPARATVDQWLSQQLALRTNSSLQDRSIFISSVQRLVYAPMGVQRASLAQERSAIRRVCWSLIFSGLVASVRPGRVINRPYSTDLPQGAAS